MRPTSQHSARLPFATIELLRRMSILSATGLTYYCGCCSKPAPIGDGGHEKSIWEVVAHSAPDDAVCWDGNLGIPGNNPVRAGAILQSLEEGSQLLHPGRERLQGRSHSGGSPFSNWLPLHLREAAVDKQLCSCDEACVIGGKKHNCLGDLIGRA